MLKNNQLSPCTQFEVTNLEKQLEVSLPEIYKRILLKMGKGAGNFWVGEDCFYRHLPSIQEWAKDLLAENHFLSLPHDAFVFFMHQGYQFSFFRLSEGDNPPIYSYSEAQKEPSFITTQAHLTDFLATEIELYEKYSSNLVAA